MTTTSTADFRHLLAEALANLDLDRLPTREWEVVEGRQEFQAGFGAQLPQAVAPPDPYEGTAADLADFLLEAAELELDADDIDGAVAERTELKVLVDDDVVQFMITRHYPDEPGPYTWVTAEDWWIEATPIDETEN